MLYVISIIHIFAHTYITIYVYMYIHILIHTYRLVNNFTGMVIVVSHDRYFLNNICTDILELRSILGMYSAPS